MCVCACGCVCVWWVVGGCVRIVLLALPPILSPTLTPTRTAHSHGLRFFFFFLHRRTSPTPILSLTLAPTLFTPFVQSYPLSTTNKNYLVLDY
ncbi:hypothetical protein T492DRAFT_506064 [Pavlovales sp. CCMP2436]|nr:hypothetical protein T492DRAFT_506064 [Pavlovales sp. CCMP2436]